MFAYFDISGNKLHADDIPLTAASPTPLRKNDSEVSFITHDAPGGLTVPMGDYETNYQ